MTQALALVSGVQRVIGGFKSGPPPVRRSQYGLILAMSLFAIGYG
jgi:hypothetical protein